MTPLTGVFGHDTLMPMALAMSGFFALAFVLMCAVTRTRSSIPAH